MAAAASFLTSCVSAHVLRRFSAAVLIAGLLAAGCGDDEKGAKQATPTTDTARGDTGAATDDTEADTVTATTPTEADRTETGGSGGTGGASPEDQPGGAGDEEPARSQAAFSGRGGSISPRLIRVPPFISIRVELRSVDGRPYSLSARGRRLAVDREVSSASTTFAGLRTGRRLVLRAGNGRRVAVEASAEPGP